MKRFWAKIGAALGLTVLAGALAPACAADNSSFFIRNALAPGTPSNGICQYTADITQAGESSGVVDVLFGVTTYAPFFLVGNQILAQANVNEFQTETSRIEVTGAITKVTDLQGNVGLGTFLDDECTAEGRSGPACDVEKQFVCTQNPSASGSCKGILSSAPTQIPPIVDPFSTFEAQAIEPANGTTASYTAMPITILDSGTLGTISALFNAEAAALGTGIAGISALYQQRPSIQLVTYTTAEGVTLGNDSVQSNQFIFPVTVCYGCLAGNLGFIEATGTLCAFPSTSAATACIPGQDQAADVSAGAFGGLLPACPTEGGAPIVTVDSGA